MLTAVLAAAAAMFVGIACAAQDRATHQVATYPTLHPGLVIALTRRPWWLLGTLSSIVALGLQVSALALGSIIVVQTVMATSLGWTTLSECVLARRRPTGRALGGITLAAAGLVGLLLLLAPTSSAVTAAPSAGAATGVVAGCATVAAAGLGWSRWGPRPTRALGLAVVTGTGYGLTAALLKLVSAQLQYSWTEPLAHPALYAACVLGLVSILVSLNTFQQGRLATPAVTVILILDPVIGLVTGVLWFGERITTDPAAMLGAVAAACAAILGVALIQSAARRLVPQFSSRTHDPGLACTT